MVGWTSSEDAINYLRALDNPYKSANKHVVYKVKGAPCSKALGNRLIAHRLSGVLSEDTTISEGKHKYTIVTINANPYDERSLKQSIEDLKVSQTGDK